MQVKGGQKKEFEPAPMHGDTVGGGNERCRVHVYSLNFCLFLLKTDNPVAVCLLGTIGIMVVSQNLANLIHEILAGIRSEIFIVLHYIVM